jgi:pyruvate kinase
MRSLAGIPALLGDAAKLKHRLPLAKIVATIGPVSEQIEPMQKVFEAGMRIMRINFSHASYEEAELRVKNLNQCRGINIDNGKDATGNITNMRAIMLDTQGPEIRTGSFPEFKELELKAGSEVLLTTDEAFRNSQTASKLWISYQNLQHTVKEGSELLLDDGAIGLKVISKCGKCCCSKQANSKHRADSG